MTLNSSEALAAIRLLAIDADERSTTLTDSALIWGQLTSGESKVLDEFFDRQRCYLVLSDTFDAAPRHIAHTDLLEELLSGNQPKVLASDREMALSTVASNATQMLRLMGVRHTAYRASPLLAEAALAHSRCDHRRKLRSSAVAHEGRSYRVVSAPRPDRRLVGKLSPAELEVVQRLLEGWKHAEIASYRRTSVRTVANQLSSAFRRLGVSGRRELLSQIIREPLAELGVATEWMKAEAGAAASPHTMLPRTARARR